MPIQSTSPGMIERGIDFLQGQGGNICARPVASGQSLRMPRIVQGVDPTNPNRIVTYVKAPQVKYKVTATATRRRRCKGG